jgi:uncharacterized protein
MSNRPVHFEIAANNPQAVMDFFSKTFGWSFEQYGTESYWMATTGAEGTPGINGAIMAKRDPNQPPVNSLMVADINKAAADVEANGGKIVVPIMPVGEMGFLAYFTDPDGNIHGIWQLKQ